MQMTIITPINSHSYLTEEAIESGGPFCNSVLKDQDAIGLPPSRHDGRVNGKGRMGKKTLIPQDYNSVLEAHHNILHQLSIMEPFIEQHIDELRKQNHGHTDEWLMKEHKNKFTSWLKELDIPERETIEEHTIKALASGPSRQVTTWQSYCEHMVDKYPWMFSFMMSDRPTLERFSLSGLP